jgi:hypothetical protein
MRTLAAIFTCVFLLSLSAGPASSAVKYKLFPLGPERLISKKTRECHAAGCSGRMEVSLVSQSAPLTEVSLWPESATPGMLANPDAAPVELGLKFRSDVAGRVTGVRFYKSTTNTGTHVGQLWSSAGRLLASATFTEESASGWQTVRFASPVSIQANTLYVVSYHTDEGHYSSDNGYFGTALDVPPLRAPARTNGVYHYGASAFPTDNYRSSNYWVDVLFLAGEAPSGGGLGQYYDNPDTSPPTVAVTAPASGATVSNTFSVTGTTADNIAVSKVELQLDSGAFQMASGTTRWTYSLNTKELTNGSHSLTARATDSSGNTQTASISVRVSNTNTGNHCVSNPHLCGFPDSTNTGWQPTGVTLTSYTGPLTITAAGTVIDGKLINGVINIDADNVTIRRSKIVYPRVNCNGRCEVVRVNNDHTGFLIEDSELDGNGGLCYMSIQLGVNGTALRNNLHGCGDGVRSGDGALVKDNWMHDFGKGVFDGDPYADSPHNDGYQGISTSHVRVEHNTIILPPYTTPNPNTGVDGAVLFGDERGPITDIHFNNNLVDTTSYSIRFGYSCTRSTCEAIGNRIGRSYQMYGAFYPGVSFTKTGNVWDDTGEPVN